MIGHSRESGSIDAAFCLILTMNTMEEAFKAMAFDPVRIWFVEEDDGAVGKPES